MFMNYLSIDVREETDVPVDKAVADVDLDKYMMEEMVANGLEGPLDEPVSDKVIKSINCSNQGAAYKYHVA